MRKAPGTGVFHYQHGISCCMLNRPEEALSHLNTAARLMPGSHVTWLVKAWQSLSLGELGRWAEADAAIDEGIALNPTQGSNRVQPIACKKRSVACTLDVLQRRAGISRPHAGWA
jgi:hypothetical protein